jgi:UDP-N-acetylmuramate dehydrogenase
LFIEDFKGIVVQNKLQGITIEEEEEEYVLVKAMSGEVWHDVVLFSVDRNWWGIENLALIPGTVGGAPMQNIGAYGRELKDTLLYVYAIDIETGKERVFSNTECKFGYRDSVFKHELKGKYFITGITLKLSKKENKNIEYRVLKEYLYEHDIEPATSKVISDAVTAIRQSKLPDPKVIGNAGSFFKNTFVDESTKERLLHAYPTMPYFTEDESIKIPSAWLIEQSGPTEGVSWKGYRVGNIGVHDKQPLVLVNFGGGTGAEIHNLAKEIINSVYKKFGLMLLQKNGNRFDRMVL